MQLTTPTPGSPENSPQTGSPQAGQRNRRWRRSRAIPVAAGVVALVLATGTVAFAHAHKSVSLDVDGEVTTVTTFAGSVAGLLADRGIEVGSRDVVSPSGPLTDGAQVVVRHAHLVTVLRDGAPESVWTTALSADEALAVAAVRGGSVSLVASRSGERAERAQLPIDLTPGDAATVVVDGARRTVPDGATDVASVLAGLGVTLGPFDRVSVRHDEAGRVQLVVERVAVQDVTTTLEVPFASHTQDDPNRYRGTTAVVQAGVAGARTLVERVTTVDGVETARRTLSDTVTAAPVDEVVAVGTKARPAPAPRAASPVPSFSGDVNALNWAALAACESGGRVDAVSKSGKYHGLYQFSVSTWQAVGGSGLPSQASAEEQTARAKALYLRSGAGQWPHCGPRLFG